MKKMLAVLIGGIMSLSPAYGTVGFGTYPLKGEVCTHAVDCAIKSGYRMIDTASMYNNFAAIAKALKGHDRSQLYLISKVWHDMQAPDDVRRDLEWTLEQLEVDYLDAYLIHWPNHKIPIDQTLRAMDELRREGKIRDIGLSNVSINHLKKALEIGVPITWVQVEMHPGYYDPEFLAFCSQHSITVQTWRPLNLGRVAKDPLLIEIGKKHGKSACQIALRWIIQHGCVPLPGSKSKSHIRENLEVMDFSLSQDEMGRIDAQAASGERFRLREELGFKFSDEFDFSYEQCWTSQ